MKISAAAVFFLMLGGIANAAMQQYTVESEVVLRIEGRWSKALEESVRLDPGSVIELNESDARGPMRYEDGGSARMSNSGWYGGVKIVSMPGARRSEIRSLNNKDHFMSETHMSDLARSRGSRNANRGNNRGFKSITTNMLITLREKSGRYLVKSVDLDAGAVLSVNTKNNVGRMKYRDDSGNIKTSSRAWLQGVVIKRANGLSSSKIKRLNRKSLYVSVDVLYANSGESGRTQRPPRGGGGYRPPRRGSIRCQSDFINKGVPREALRVAIAGFKRYKRRLGNRRWLALADYTRSSRKKRFFLMDLSNCKVYSEYLSHGSGKQNGVHRGDPDNDGTLNKCKHNGRTLNMTRPGYQIIRGFHSSKKRWPKLTSSAKGLKLHGLQPFNEEVYRRAVVMHESGSMKNRSRVQTRSFGCTMFPPGRLKRLLKTVTKGQLSKGTFFLQYATQCERRY